MEIKLECHPGFDTEAYFDFISAPPGYERIFQPLPEYVDKIESFLKERSIDFVLKSFIFSEDNSYISGSSLKFNLYVPIGDATDDLQLALNLLM